MAGNGINLQSLSPDLQKRMAVYADPITKEISVAGIKQAAEHGDITQAEASELLNGAANWGRVMDEFAFDPKKADQYEKNMPEAQRQNQIAEARRRVAKKPENNPLVLDDKKREYADKRARLKYIAEHSTSQKDRLIAKAALATTPENLGVEQARFKINPIPAMVILAIALEACTKEELHQNAKQEQKAQDVVTPMKEGFDKVTKLQNTIIDLLKALSDKIEEGDRKILNSLTNIYGAIIDIGDEIADNAGKVNAMLKDIQYWLETIEANQQTQIEWQIKGYNSFNEFKADLLDLLQKIEANQSKPEERQKYIQQIMEKMEAIETVSVDTNKKVTEINETVKNLKLNFQYDDSAILEAIDKLAAKGDTANRFLELILDAMAGLGDDMRSYFGDLIKMAIQGNANIDDLKKLMTEINNNVKANGKQAHDDAQAILAAIKKLGVDVSGDLAKILNAIRSIPDWQQKDYSEALQAILDKINEGNKANDANFKAVLAKIGELGAKVTVGMNAILNAIQTLPDYSTRLDAILKKLDALGSKAQEILEAIKDHDVKITIDDLNVKVTCECNCGNGGKHEGIIGNLTELLG